MINKVNAIQTLRPGAEWTVRDDKVEWLDENQTRPTDEEIEIEIKRLQSEFDNNEYARLRKIEYDKLNQDEMRFDDLMNGTTIWQDSILAIKAKYPKPE